MNLFDELRIDRDPAHYAQIREDFRRRSWRQFALVVTVVLVFVAGAKFGKDARWIEVGTPIAMISLLVLSFFNWRCPACNVFWGKRWPRGRCPECRTSLED